MLAGLFVLLKAVAYYLDRYELLYSDRSDIFTGATYTDLNAVMPAKLILLFISIICAAAFFVAVFRRNLQLPAIATVLLILSSVLVGAAWPQVLQQFVVAPNANERESIPIERNIAATRQAFGLTDDKVTEVPFTGTSQVSPSEVRNDTATVPNIRLLDPAKLGETFTQLQQRRQFYGFPAKLDIDRYAVGGKTEDYIVAARELNSNGLAGNQTDWINRRLVYTHGNGLVVAPANRVNASLDDTGGQGGLPVFTSIDTATAQSTSIPEELRVAEPRIYYGELIDGYSIVGAEEGAAPREYDSDTQSYTYHGKGGVPLGNIVNRMVFSLLYGERNILFNNSINDNSKIMYVRDPGERVQAVAPWLTPDSDPYPAVVDGRITWIVDGYTTLQHYPYAQNMSLGQATTDALQPLQRPELDRDVSYLRNSVKATVDAYDGTVTLYAFDESDPVLQTWMKTFPGSVKPASEISPSLRSHFRYPEDLFKVQRELLTRYHVDNPLEFYGNASFWGVPSDPTVQGGGAGGAPQPPYYVLAGATGRGGGEHPVVPADQRPGVPEPADPVGLRVGQLRSGQLRQDHGAAAATGHADPRSTAGADPAGRLTGGQCRARAAVPRRPEHGQLREPADAAGGRRAALRGTGLHRAGQPGVQLSTAGPGAGVLQRPGGLRPEPVRGAGRGVRTGRGRRCDADARRRRTRRRRPVPPAGPARRWPRRRPSCSRRWGRCAAAQQSGDLGSLGQALTALDTAVKNFQTANGQAPAPAPRRLRSRVPAAEGRRPEAGQSTDLRGGPRRRQRFAGVYCRRHNSNAGWSSSVARWAHNPEVVGSNPTPATRSKRPSGDHPGGRFAPVVTRSVTSVPISQPPGRRRGGVGCGRRRVRPLRGRGRWNGARRCRADATAVTGPGPVLGTSTQEANAATATDEQAARRRKGQE